MKTSHLLLLVLGMVALVVLAVFNPKRPHGPGPSPAPVPKRTFTIENDRFIKDGERLRLISGSIHYHRISPTYWRDRLLRVRALGLNSVEMYVPWNWHAPQPGEFVWSGGRNVTRFLDLAQELGLNVVLRPGPYVCAEWDNGGFPWWLATSKVRGGRTMALREADEDYLEQVERWWDELLPRLAPYLHQRGGPIILVQIENEYGFCPFNDKVYLRRLVGLARKALGPDAVLFTTDPPQVTPIGSLPGDEVLTVVDFGPGVDPAWAFAAQAAMNPDGKSPPFCSEFYTGWLSHWGEVMANTTAQLVVNSLRAILEYANNTGSVNFYMAHGGTNFGYWAGANKAASIYQPHITSYDYDCPVGEAGGYGQPGIGGPSKFELLRSLIADVTGEAPPDAPPPPVLRGYGPVALNEGALLLEELGAFVPGDGIAVDRPDIMEEYGQSGGLILYRTKVPASALNGASVLDIGEPVRDYAKVLVDGRVVGRLERSNPRNLTLPAAAGGNADATLDILVEALGRVNFGCEWDFKGLTSPDVRLNGTVLTGWRVFPLPLDNPAAVRFRPRAALGASSAAEKGPVFYRGMLRINGSQEGTNAEGTLPDTYIDVRGWGKGLLWVNGVNLGWFWPSAGPQEAQYVPGPLLLDGDNEVILMETEVLPSNPSVVSTPHANFFGPFSASGVSRAPAPPAFDRSAYLPARAQQAYERTVGSTLADAQTT